MNDNKKRMVQLPDGSYFIFEDHNLYSADGAMISENLDGLPYDVLYCLAECHPSPQSVNQLIELIWEKKDPPVIPNPSRVRQVVGELRRFLRDPGPYPYKYIITVKKSILSEGGYKCCSKIVPFSPMDDSCGQPNSTTFPVLAPTTKGDNSNIFVPISIKVDIDKSNYKSQVYIKRASEVMSNLQNALDLLKKTNEIILFEKIRREILIELGRCPRYAELILSIFPGSDDEDITVLTEKWDSISNKLRNKLIQLMDHHIAVILQEDYGSPKLKDLKIGLLASITDFHIEVALLAETLIREAANLERAANETEKEYVQKAIKCARDKYDHFFSHAEKDDKELDDAIAAFKESLIIDNTTL